MSCFCSTDLTLLSCSIFYFSLFNISLALSMCLTPLSLSRTHTLSVIYFHWVVFEGLMCFSPAMACLFFFSFPYYPPVLLHLPFFNSSDRELFQPTLVAVWVGLWADVHRRAQNTKVTTCFDDYAFHLQETQQVCLLHLLQMRLRPKWKVQILWWVNGT